MPPAARFGKLPTQFYLPVQPLRLSLNLALTPMPLSPDPASRMLTNPPLLLLLADIKFNLMRAIEFFEDMNYLDMDVMAPTSSHSYFKEIEVAQRLNIFLGQLIQEGVFDDCELRGKYR